MYHLLSFLFWKNEENGLVSDRKQEGESYEKRK